MTATPGGGKQNEKTEHLCLALRAIREVDQLLIKAGDRSRLLQDICDTLIKNRSYYNAWIVLLNESGRLRDTAEAGLGSEFYPMLERLRRGEFTECSKRALAQHSVVVIDRPYSVCTDCPLSGKYSGRSAMTVRLENQGQVFGLLCVSMPRRFTENEEELELLQEIAGDIAFGLSKLGLEEELKENRQSFEDLVENSPAGILIVQDGIVIYRNPEGKRISGAFHKVGGRFAFTGVHPDDAEKAQHLYEKVISGAEQTVHTDFRFYSSEGKKSRADMKWVHFHASSIDYKGREAELINMVDITQAKELEQLVVVKDKMASLGHIAAGVAHEIRNPLSGINIYLNTLETVLDDPDTPETARKIIDQIQSASSKIESIIKRVIDFSKPSEPNFVLTDISKPIEEAIELSSVAIRKRGIKIEKSLANDLPPCLLDPTLIEEVILNLINNAAEAMKDEEGDKLIAIEVGAKDNHILVQVSDSGPGIPPELRTKVLEPFYTTKKSGTGIGLSLCHRIVTDHGGSITVEKSKWSGAEFIVKIPIERSP